MAKDNKNKKNQFILLSKILALPFLAILIGTVFFFLSHTSNTKSALESSSGTNEAPFGQFKTFTSQDLGISFDYAAGTGNQKVIVKEIGSKVFLYIDYTNSGDPATGKFVEVFTKDTNESLENAVRSRFLQGYSPSDCMVIPARLSVGFKNPAREYVQITTPHLSASEYSVRRQLDDATNCPATYTTSRLTGTAYFMMDPKYPNKYVYFKLGSDNFLAAPWTGKGSPRTWDQTLTFIYK